MLNAPFYGTAFTCDNYTRTQGNYLTLNETANLLFSHTVRARCKNILNQACVLKLLNGRKKRKLGKIIQEYFQTIFNKYNQEKNFLKTSV